MAGSNICWVVLLLALVCGGATPARAETRYVSDVLVINLRDTPTAGGNTLEHLRTGESFEVLGAQGSYLRVRTPGGQEGWVPQQYTTAELPKAELVSGLRRELAQLQQQTTAAEAERTKLQDQVRQLEGDQNAALRGAEQGLAAARKEAEDSRAQYAQVKAKYEALLSTSKQILETTAERDALQERNAQLATQVQQISGELASVTRSNLITGLLAGGGLVLAGWVLGSTARKKKSRFSMG